MKLLLLLLLLASAALICAQRGRPLRHRCFGRSPPSGRTILITGSTAGIGRETAKQLAEQGHLLVLHGRNRSRCHDIRKWLRSRVPSAKSCCFVANFEDLSQVVDLADKVKRNVPHLDTIILNAGIYKDYMEYTKHGLEKTFQVNHLAPFLLAHHLVDAVKSKKDARIIFTSSSFHSMVKATSWDDFNSTEPLTGPDFYIEGKWFSKEGIEAYDRSKLYLIMTSDLLTQALKGTGVTSNSLHPGHFKTKLTKWTGNPVDQVEILTYLATDPHVKGVTGKYFDEFAKEKWEDAVAVKSVLALDEGNRKELCLTSLGILCSLKIPVPNPVCP